MFSDAALAAPGVEKTTETVDIELGEVEAAPASADACMRTNNAAPGMC